MNGFILEAANEVIIDELCATHGCYFVEADMVMLTAEHTVTLGRYRGCLDCDG